MTETVLEGSQIVEVGVPKLLLVLPGQVVLTGGPRYLAIAGLVTVPEVIDEVLVALHADHVAGPHLGEAGRVGGAHLVAAGLELPPLVDDGEYAGLGV